MYICGKCKKEMKIVNNCEAICKRCNNEHKLDSNSEDDYDINIVMDYKSFKDFLKIIN